MGIKRAIKRGLVKTHRKVFGKPREIMITTGRGGLTKTEIKDVLDILGEAVRKKEVSNFTYEYRPPVPILSSREPLNLIPKTVPVATFRRQVNRVIRREYGGGYIIAGYSGKDTGINKPTISKRTQLGHRGLPRITPKTPRLRR